MKRGHFKRKIVFKHLQNHHFSGDISVFEGVFIYSDETSNKNKPLHNHGCKGICLDFGGFSDTKKSTFLTFQQNDTFFGKCHGGAVAKKKMNKQKMVYTPLKKRWCVFNVSFGVVFLPDADAVSHAIFSEPLWLSH